ncbi:MAG: hypothetical protein AWU57_335 [Marinobacter sp. T13-3]|nr:MAG: hypothetical protein AWU57_335 [Marinobacter sp. T13-3]
MPSTLNQLTEAWREEAAAGIRRTLLNQSPRKDRKWKEIVGNEPMRYLPIMTQEAVYRGMPTPARRLLVCQSNAQTRRLDELLLAHAQPYLAMESDQ